MMETWMQVAHPALVTLLRRMTKHANLRWRAEDYDEGSPEPRVVQELEDAEAVGSWLRPPPRTAIPADQPDLHCIAIDIDVPAWLIPSSTPGHSHLYVALETEWPELLRWLEAGVQIGLVEEGYVNACRDQWKMTMLRLPWVQKGRERPAREVVSE